MSFLPSFQAAFDAIQAKLNAGPDPAVIQAAVDAATAPLQTQIDDLTSQLAAKTADETDTANQFDTLAGVPVS